MSKKINNRTYVEVHPAPRKKGGRKSLVAEKFVYILDLLGLTFKCGCFGVDCCTGFMREPTADGSTKIYSSIIGDEKVYFTKEEMEAWIAKNAGQVAKTKADCGGDC